MGCWGASDGGRLGMSNRITIGIVLALMSTGAALADQVSCPCDTSGSIRKWVELGLFTRYDGFSSDLAVGFDRPAWFAEWYLRGFLYFDTSYIPDNAIIDNVQLEIALKYPTLGGTATMVRPLQISPDQFYWLTDELRWYQLRSNQGGQAINEPTQTETYAATDLSSEAREELKYRLVDDWFGLAFFEVTQTDETSLRKFYGCGEYAARLVVDYHVPSTDQPDLVGWEFSIPDEIEWGEIVATPHARLMNIGPADVTDNFLVRVVLSNDLTFGDGDDVELVGGQLTYEEDLPAYTAGSLFAIGFMLPSPPPEEDYEGNGPFYIAMYTDADNQIDEQEEGNNFGAFGEEEDWDSFLVTGLYPLLESIEISGPVDVPENQTCQYLCRTHYSDQTWADVTAETYWATGCPYAHFDGTPGELSTDSVTTDHACQISASYEGQNVAYDIVIRDDGIPEAPTDLMVYAVSHNEIHMFWLDHSYNEDGFRIERKLGAAGTWAEIHVTAAGRYYYDDLGLEPDTTYYYRVRAFNAQGASDYSNEDSATTDELVLQPDLFGIGFDVDPNGELDAGQDISVDLEIENSGTADSGPFNVGIYLSENDIISRGDFRLGTYRAEPGVAAGDWEDYLAYLTLPPPGHEVWDGDDYYFIGMIIDVDYETDDSDRGNNANEGDGLDRSEVYVSETAGSPLIQVFQDATEIIDGVSTVDFGTVYLGDPGNELVFTVINDGTAELVFDGNTNVPNWYTLLEGLPASLPPDSSDTFTLRLDSDEIGVHQGQFGFGHNAPAGGWFDFIVTGEVLTPVLTISGRVHLADGTGVPDVELFGLPGNPLTDPNGFYSVGVEYGWSYTVVPVNPAYTYDPTHRDYADVTTSWPDQDYEATPITYTISGTVQLDGAGLPDVVMTGFPVAAPATGADGTYSGQVPHNWSGTIEPEKDGYEFVPSQIDYQQVVSNQVSQDYIAHVTLGEALDALELVWETGGTFDEQSYWHGQTNETHDGVDAARSGLIWSELQPGSSWLRTTVEGPGLLTFWWTIDFTFTGRCAFKIDGQEIASHSNLGWTEQAHALSAGPHVIEWVASASTVAMGSCVLDQVSIHSTAELADALDAEELLWSTGGTDGADSFWTAQNENTHDGVDAAMSGSLAEPGGPGGNSWLRTTVTGPVEVTFWWMATDAVDTAGYSFSVDGQVRASHAGTAWRSESVRMGSGTHELQWLAYDGLAGGGGILYVDQVAVTPIEFIHIGVALDNPGLNWTTGGTDSTLSNWIGHSGETHDAVDAAMSGSIYTPGAIGGNSWLRTTIAGPAEISFWWMATPAAEITGYTFSVDGEVAVSHAGTPWRPEAVRVGPGMHEIEWRAIEAPAGGGGTMYVDEVVITAIEFI